MHQSIIFCYLFAIANLAFIGVSLRSAPMGETGGRHTRAEFGGRGGGGAIIEPAEREEACPRKRRARLRRRDRARKSTAARFAPTLTWSPITHARNVDPLPRSRRSSPFTRAKDTLDDDSCKFSRIPSVCHRTRCGIRAGADFGRFQKRTSSDLTLLAAPRGVHPHIRGVREVAPRSTSARVL